MDNPEGIKMLSAARMAFINKRLYRDSRGAGGMLCWKPGECVRFLYADDESAISINRGLLRHSHLNVTVG